MNMALARSGTALLLLATLVAGISILAGGDIGRALNGVAGLCWFTAAGVLVSAALKASRQAMPWIVVVGLTAVVAFIIRPSDLLLAAVGFGGAGLVVGLLARNHELLWVRLVPALYLPFHIGTALLWALFRSMTGAEASIRSEPPPTAAVVPLMMIVAAMAGGYVAVTIKTRRSPLADRKMSTASS